LILAVLARDESRGLAERLGVVLAIDRHRNLGRIGEAGKFDFEIERCAGQDLGPIDRVDRLRKACRTGSQERNSGRRGRKSVHVRKSSKEQRDESYSAFMTFRLQLCDKAGRLGVVPPI
jgi:hypothetical protein